MRRLQWLSLAALLAAGSASADSVTVEMNAVSSDGVGEAIGSVTATDTGYGVVFSPELRALSPGLHGFHVHQNPSCEPAEKDGTMVAGLSAGGHFDPLNAGAHEGPYGDGHLGDLPALYVDAQGNATHPLLAPRLTVSNLSGRSLMIHGGGDNYSDDPKALGGGGPRVACGVVK